MYTELYVYGWEVKKFMEKIFLVELVWFWN